MKRYKVFAQTPAKPQLKITNHGRPNGALIYCPKFDLQRTSPQQKKSKSMSISSKAYLTHLNVSTSSQSSSLILIDSNI
jgi:hypothetical protein